MSDDASLDRLVKLRDVADMIGVGLRTVYRLIAAGELPEPVKVGHRSCIPESELRDYIERVKRERRR